MNHEPPKNSRLSHLPGILAASAALIAAVSTLYVNLRPAPTDAAAPTQAAVPAAAKRKAAVAPAVAPEPKAVLLRLERVQVENDGSMGTTDWTFEVSAAGEPRFTLPMRSLSDKPGHNLARPADPGQAVAELLLAPDQQLQVAVKGWKEGFLPGSGAEVGGAAWVSGKPGTASIHVSADRPKSPAFTLYFTVEPKP